MFGGKPEAIPVILIPAMNPLCQIEALTVSQLNVCRKAQGRGI